MSPIQRAPLAVLLLSALLQTAPAQCKVPQPPVGGFAVKEELDQLVTFVDGVTTRVDIRLPAAAPGSCGWPVVIWAHGSGDSRKATAVPSMFANLRRYAASGYITAAYDIRGQGQSTGGARIFGEPEILDIAEVVAYIEKKYGMGSQPLADMKRVGITGVSQGGFHAWGAAAWSGKQLPPNSRNLARYPEFAAAFSWIGPPEGPQIWVPEGKAFHRTMCTALFANDPRYRMDPVFRDKLRTGVLNEDFAGVTAMLSTPLRRVLAELPSSDVPMFAAAAWQDYFYPVDQTLEALDLLPATTPRRALFGPSGNQGHLTPENIRADAEREMLRDRWFARYLKGHDNGVDREPRYLTGVIPETLNRHRNRRELYWNRYHDRWPPPQTRARRYYLRQNGLSEIPPTASEPADTVVHSVPQAFGIAAYINLTRYINSVLREVPLSSVAYDTTPLDADLEIAGATKVRLEVNPASPNYQVHCALYQVPTNGPERYMGSGYALVRGGSIAPTQLDIEIQHLNARFVRGDRIRLRVENLVLRKPALGDQNLWVTPYFESTKFEIEHSVARVSWLDLPIRDVVQPALASPTLCVDVANPSDVQFELETPEAMAGSVYAVLFSLSGIATTTHLPGSDPLRLTCDPLTVSFLSAVNTPLLPHTLGTLSAKGAASPRLALSTVQIGLVSMRGVRLNAAAVVQSGASLLATNPVDVFLK